MVASVCMLEGQVVVKNFGVEPMVASFTITVGADGSVKNKPRCRGLGLVCSSVQVVCM